MLMCLIALMCMHARAYVLLPQWRIKKLYRHFHQDRCCCLLGLHTDDYCFWLITMCADTEDGLLAADTAPVADVFCWIMLAALVRRLISHPVNMTAGTTTVVHTTKMSQSRAFRVLLRTVYSSEH